MSVDEKDLEKGQEEIAELSIDELESVTGGISTVTIPSPPISTITSGPVSSIPEPPISTITSAPTEADQATLKGAIYHEP